MLIKLAGMGYTIYFKDPYNTFDCIIVCLSILDISLNELLGSAAGGAVSALRAFRLLRIFKLAKSWKKF